MLGHTLLFAAPARERSVTGFPQHLRLISASWFSKKFVWEMSVKVSVRLPGIPFKIGSSVKGLRRGEGPLDTGTERAVVIGSIS
jgi:hypothetical protein